MPKSDIQKSMIFGILKNPPKLLNQSTRGRQSLGFGTKKLPFNINIGIEFPFFPKLQKCEISEEYNAKRGSEPSKTFDDRI